MESSILAEKVYWTQEVHSGVLGNQEVLRPNGDHKNVS